MRNFIRQNIQIVKGSKRAVTIEKQAKKSPTKYRVMPSNLLNSRLKNMQLQLQTYGQEKHQELFDQLASIKDDIRMIKSYLLERKESFDGNYSLHERHTYEGRQDTHESQTEEEFNASNPGSVGNPAKPRQQIKLNKSNIKSTGVQQFILGRSKWQSGDPRGSISVKALYPMLKQYKLQGPTRGNMFFGYSKRTSQPVVVKYSEESLSSIIQIYDRLWRNMPKAKWPCVNKVLDYKEEDCAVIVLERNKSNIVGLPPRNLLMDMLRILELIHECGYLYRNVEPEHFMLNENGQLIAIDFKRAKRFIDIRGHDLQVQDIHNGSPFASNNQVKGALEGRKDDLESLGYLGLLLEEIPIPWLGASREQIIKIRSGLTLNELFKGYPYLTQYMAVVLKTTRLERPDYKKLFSILQYA